MTSAPEPSHRASQRYRIPPYTRCMLNNPSGQVISSRGAVRRDRPLQRLRPQHCPEIVQRSSTSGRLLELHRLYVKTSPDSGVGASLAPQISPHRSKSSVWRESHGRTGAVQSAEYLKRQEIDNPVPALRRRQVSYDPPLRTAAGTYGKDHVQKG